MLLKLFFDISTSFRFSKISVECTLHSEAPPWLEQFACFFYEAEKWSWLILVTSLLVVKPQFLGCVSSMQPRRPMFFFTAVLLFLFCRIVILFLPLLKSFIFLRSKLARNMWKIFSLVLSKKPITRENWCHSYDDATPLSF